ncbi:hypothetical protein HXX76_016340, partial [Chlamydomonas incerta]
MPPKPESYLKWLSQAPECEQCRLVIRYDYDWEAVIQELGYLRSQHKDGDSDSAAELSRTLDLRVIKGRLNLPLEGLQATRRGDTCVYDFDPALFKTDLQPYYTAPAAAGTKPVVHIKSEPGVDDGLAAVGPVQGVQEQQ